MSGVEGGDTHEQKLDEEARGQKLDEAEQEIPDADSPMEKVGPDQKVVLGLARQWRALENARFIPKQGDRRSLMYDIKILAGRDPGAMYEWLKNIIISCSYIKPGHDTFRDIKIKTIAMLRKMLDPEGVCGVDVAETDSWRSLANHCSSLFTNVAGELICQWTEGDDNEEVYFPSVDINHVIAEVSKVDDDVKDDLNKCSDNNIDHPDNRVPASRAFYCLRPLSNNEIGNLELDGENVVRCPTHCPQRNLADCAYCHAGQQQLVERADILCRQAEGKSEVRGVNKVFCPLASAKQTPMELWKYFDSKEGAKGWMVPKMVGLEGLRMEIPHPDTPLARWRINLRECLSYTILVTCPDVMSYIMSIRSGRTCSASRCLKNSRLITNYVKARFLRVCSQLQSLTSRHALWTKVKNQSVDGRGRASCVTHSRRHGIVGTT